MLVWVQPAAARRYRFDLPPELLSASIARIGAVTGASIATSQPTLLDGPARALSIEGSAGKALSALLAGTGARAVRVGPSDWRIEATRNSQLNQRHPSDPVEVSEIIVTGSKREAALSDYPASVAVIGGEDLSRYGAVPDNAAIERLNPALESTHLGPGRDKLFLRGIADSSFNGSGPALVGRYIDDFRLTYNAPDPDLRLYDVSEVEILEGAQGTLYGAGSMAGLIRTTPNAPDARKTAGDFWVGGSLVAHGTAGGDIGGMLNLPILEDRLALRVIGYAMRDGGYIDDDVAGADDVNLTKIYGGRATLRSSLGAEWLIDLTGIVQDIRNSDAQYTERGLPPLTRSSVFGQPSFNLFRSGAVVLSGPIGEVHFVSTTGIVRQALEQHFETEPSVGDALYSQHDGVRLLSEEAHLSSKREGILDWVAGLSLLSSKTDQRRSSETEGFVGSLGRARNSVSDLTAFGELTYHFTAGLSLTAGTRFAAVRLAGVASGADVKSLPGSPSPFDGVRHEHFFVPSLALSWKPNTTILVFGRYSQGYRPGGLTASGIVERYNSDAIDSIEIGTRLMADPGQRVSLELSGVGSVWHHIQADVLDGFGLPEVQNIGDGRVHSVTATASWKPLVRLEAKLAATIASSSVKNFDVVLDQTIRTRLPDVAGDTVVASIDYRTTISGHPFTVGCRANHIGHSVLGSGSELSQYRQGGYWVAALGAETDLGPARVTLNIDNLFDSRANSFAFGEPSTVYTNRYLTPLRPRTIRIGFDHRF